MSEATALDLHAEGRQPITAPSIIHEPANLTPMQMAYQLISNGADLGSVKEMLALSKELAADQAKRAFDKAVAKAKANIGPVMKNREGHNKTRYADFAAYAKVVDPVLSEYGLSYRFRTAQTDRISVTCIISHEEGHAEENTLSGPADTSGSKNAIQAVGSTLSYLQRYTLVQALGLSASVDDDGQTAGKSADEMQTITKDQVKTILQLLEDTQSDTAQFCQMGKIDAVPDMRAADFPHAVRLLEQKKVKMGRVA